MPGRTIARISRGPQQLQPFAGKVTVNFTNDSALQHDVVLVDSQNKMLGQTPVFQGGTDGQVGVEY